MASRLSLADLEARFQAHSLQPAGKHHGRKLADGSTQWGGFPVHTFSTVRKRRNADRVHFLCPKCFAANGGAVGTHGIAIDFIGGRTPDEACVHNKKGEAVRWTASNDPLASLTLSPSIQIIGGCNWHGWVQNGQIKHA